ncbi:heme chaperone HemW [Microbulbifer aestuariivivens]|uniref:Heme chaperone HemW n=1 Tax=Microbulbifer aestuariivivens TaxID=1908308 RepID=A0ABP9WM65_9GAMM
MSKPESDPGPEPGAAQLSLPPLSLYVHIPWCVRKCPYCDFNSHAAGETLPEADYVQQLRRDLHSQLPWVQGRRLSSIFFGGGTPSLFSAAAIADILGAAEELIGFTRDIEITLEANPGTFEQQKFAGYRDAGVNRLSIGVQSFDAQQLDNLGRIHSGAEAAGALAMARRAGFDNINLDLMHGLPQQTEAEALADLERAVDLAPEHISWYQLTIEPNTAFYSAPPLVPGPAHIVSMQGAGRDLLARNGYHRYEVSAYAREGREARHNLNYWGFGDYLGIGAGAHGKLTLPGEGRVVRTRRTRAPRHYLALAGGRDGLLPAPQGEAVAKEELPLEFLMNALRLVRGVPVDVFKRYTGLPLSALAAVWPALEQMELVEPLDSRVAASVFGFDYIDEILQRFLEQPQKRPNSSRP